jgi:hypothetical protein
MVMKMSVPRVICELLQWRREEDNIVGEVYNIRDLDRTDPYALVERQTRVFRVLDEAHYPAAGEEEEYILFRLQTKDYVKCFVAERREWPEALKVLLSKPPEDQS